jgi:hypothetical protein
MTNKVKVAFVLPEPLQKDFKSHMVQNGYDLKGKSRWVSEAVEMLLQFSGYADLVKLNDEMSGFDKLESIVIERSLKKMITEASIAVRQKYPSLEGVQSRIVRTAIVQRLIRA